MKNAKTKKIVSVKSLRDKADKIWSNIVKERDGRCIICGSTDRLNAHHIFTKKAHAHMRYMLENGIALCAGHHIFGVHIDPALYMGKITKHIGQEEFDRLEVIAHNKPGPIRAEHIEAAIYRLTSKSEDDKLFMPLSDVGTCTWIDHVVPLSRGGTHI